MLKIYLETVFIYFVVYIATGILFKKEYIKARDKARKELNDNSEIYGVIRTTFTYLIISFIPLIRFLGIFGKMWMIVDIDSYIKRVKKNRKR